MYLDAHPTLAPPTHSMADDTRVDTELNYDPGWDFGEDVDSLSPEAARCSEPETLFHEGARKRLSALSIQLAPATAAYCVWKAPLPGKQPCAEPTCKAEATLNCPTCKSDRADSTYCTLHGTAHCRDRLGHTVYNRGTSQPSGWCILFKQDLHIKHLCT